MISDHTVDSTFPVDARYERPPVVNPPLLKEVPDNTRKGVADESAFLNLLTLAQSVIQWEENALSAVGFTRGRFKILTMLCAKDDVVHRPSEFAAAFGITRATVTGLLDTLTACGYITRDLDNNDRRSFLIKVTPLGREIFERSMPQYEIFAKNLADLFTREERQQLDHLAAKIRLASVAQGKAAIF